MLCLSRKTGEAVTLTMAGEIVRVIVLEIDHGRVRLGFEANQAVQILRDELLPAREKVSHDHS